MGDDKVCVSITNFWLLVLLLTILLCPGCKNSKLKGSWCLKKYVLNDSVHYENSGPCSFNYPEVMFHFKEKESPSSYLSNDLVTIFIPRNDFSYEFLGPFNCTYSNNNSSLYIDSTGILGLPSYNPFCGLYEVHLISDSIVELQMDTFYIKIRKLSDPLEF